MSSLPPPDKPVSIIEVFDTDSAPAASYLKSSTFKQSFLLAMVTPSSPAPHPPPHDSHLFQLFLTARLTVGTVFCAHKF